MDKLRFKQAQKLIKEAGNREVTEKKLNKPQKGVINTLLFERSLEEFIEAEDFLYSSRPSHELDNDEAKLFCAKILSITDKLDEILSDFGVIPKVSVENEIKRISEKILFLTTKNNFKKIFIKFGVDPQNIIVTGVPLKASDMKTLNPKIPDSALEGISKKIEHVNNDIERKISNLNPEKVIVVIENDKAGKILAKRSIEFYNAKIASLENLKDITPQNFKEIISWHYPYDFFLIINYIYKSVNAT